MLILATTKRKAEFFSLMNVYQKGDGKFSCVVSKTNRSFKNIRK